MSPGLPAPAGHLYVELDGAGVDPRRLEVAVRALVARHASLAPCERGLRVHNFWSCTAEQADRGLARLRRMAETERELARLGRELSRVVSWTPGAWLDGRVTESSGGLLISWSAREDMVAPDPLDTMFALHGRLVDRLTADDDAWHKSPSGLMDRR